MANFKKVNKFIKENYPEYDIEIVSGSGYAYFMGDDGFDKIDSIYTNPRTTSTEDMIDFVKCEIDDIVNRQIGV